MKRVKKKNLFLICACSYGLMIVLLFFPALVNIGKHMEEIIFLCILILYAIGTLSFGMALSDNENLFVLMENYEDIEEDLLIELLEIINERKRELQMNDTNIRQ